MKKLLPFIFTLLAFTACNKPDPNPPEDEPEECIDEYGLPCLKTEGGNMFACLVDGEPFIAGVQNYTIGGAVPVSGFYDESDSLLFFQGVYEDETDRIQKIYIRATITPVKGEYLLTSNTDKFKGYDDLDGINCDYYYDTTNYGVLNIHRFDKVNRCISSYFNMTLINPDCSKSTMEITQGRFHFNY